MTPETLQFIHSILGSLTLRPAPDLEESAHRLMTAIREVEDELGRQTSLELVAEDPEP